MFQRKDYTRPNPTFRSKHKEEIVDAVFEKIQFNPEQINQLVSDLKTKTKRIRDGQKATSFNQT